MHEWTEYLLSGTVLHGPALFPQVLPPSACIASNSLRPLEASGSGEWEELDVGDCVLLALL